MKLSNADLRKAQLLMLKILREVHRVCEENGIHYFLSDGTLIGAVRHNGFIPWDDDLDIGMLRADYEKFCQIAGKKLGEEYFFQTCRTDKGYGLQFGKVMLKNTTWIEYAARKTKRKETGIYIDVFPYDKIPMERKIQRKHYFWFKFWNSLIHHKNKYYYISNSKGFIHKLFFLILEMLSFFIPLEFCIQKREFLCRKYENLTENFFVTEFGGDFLKSQNNYDSFKNLVLHEFEGELFYIPKAYDSILTNLYGDYMTLPPVEYRQNHGIVEYDFGEGI